MPDSVAQSLLRRICVSCNVRVTGEVRREPKAGREVWVISAFRVTDHWTTVHENRYKAACELAGWWGLRLGTAETRLRAAGRSALALARSANTQG